MKSHVFPRSTYFPKTARVIKYRKPAAEVAVYDRGGKFCAAMFGGKRSKPDQHYSYRTEEARKKAVDEYIRKLKAGEEAKAEYMARRQGGHSLSVGDVLYNSWGYDQTNVDFYEVVTVCSKCFVEVRPIGQGLAFGTERGGPSERVMPARGKFTGPATRVKATADNHVKVGDYRHASPWNGQALHQTGFGWGH